MNPSDELPRINVDINFGTLVHLLRDRILVVFKEHGFAPTPEGWQELALEYMLKHEPAMKVIPGQLDKRRHLTEFANISLHRGSGSVYSVAKKLYGKRGDTLRTRYSEAQKHRRERKEKGLPQDPHGRFHLALMLALLDIEKSIKNK